MGRFRSGSGRTSPGRLTIVPAARAMPSSTGLTASRWLGFGARWICRSTSAPCWSWYLRWAPLWYFTSPVQPVSLPVLLTRCTGSRNSARMCSQGLFRMWASTLSRPRWAMPIRMLQVLFSAASPITPSRMRIMVSRPSMENRVLPGKVRCRNCSKTSTSVRRSRMARALSSSSEGLNRPVSAASCSHSRSPGTSMCM